MALLVLSAAGAQTPAPTAPTGAATNAPRPATPTPSTRVKRVAPPTDADARHCLELPTNLEVIACAEKYRAR
jgi:hypothetical protein